MKKIELTTEQISRILEMAKVVLPQYKNITFEQEASLGAFNYDFNNIVVSNEEKYSDHLWKGISLHWFEFLYTNVAPFIFNHVKFPLYGEAHGFYTMISEQIFYTDFHLVDFLYNYFTLIKND